MQQSIHSVTSPIHAKIYIPGSKDITFRVLLIAALADGVSEITGLEISEDTRALANALYQLGIAIQLDEKIPSCIIAGGNGKFPKKQATVWCRDNQTIVNYLLTACTASQGSYYFDGLPALREHSIETLVNILIRQGVQFTPSDTHHLPLTLTGVDSLEGGEIILDDAMTNQLGSALFMIAPFARSAFQFNSSHSMSTGDIDLTCEVMAEFDVLVHRMHQTQFMIPVPQRYKAKDYVIEPDFSLAAYFFAAAVITGGEITIQAVKRNQSKQSSVKFLSILENLGCRVFETHTGLAIKGCAELQGIEVSMKDFPDTFPALAAIAPFAKSPIRITDIDQPERIRALKEEFIKLDIQVETGENWLKIFPSRPRGALVNSHNDVYLAMALAVIGLKTPGVIVDNLDCVSYVYPDFLTLWNKLSETLDVSA